MKIALFQMNFQAAVSCGMPIINTLHDGGAEIILVNYWCSDYFPYSELQQFGEQFTYLTLTDNGFDAVPQLSRDQYRRLCGDDIDFPRCLSHVYVNAGYPTDPEHMYTDSGFYRRYYGFAWRAEHLLAAIAPDYVLVQQGGEAIAKIIYAKARKLGIPTCLWESSFFPGKILVDDRGMHFFSGFNRVDCDWPTVKSRKLTPQQGGRLEDFISRWKAGVESKYSQSTSDEERAALDKFIQPGEKMLFFPGQLSHDANVITGLHVFDDYARILPFLRENLPAGWKLVHKIHPMDTENAMPAGPLDEKTFVVRDFNIHELITRSDALFVHSSNVGLESLIYTKPVICAGRPHYAGKGLTLDLLKREDFPSLLQQTCGFSPPEDKLASFLHYIIFEYLIDEGDFDSLKKRLQSAAGGEPATDISAPFCEGYPPAARRYLELVRSYRPEELDVTSDEEPAGWPEYVAGPAWITNENGEETLRFSVSDLRVDCKEFCHGDRIITTPVLRRLAGWKSETVSYGPYCRLSAGRYIVRLDMDAAAGALRTPFFTVSLTANCGQNVLYRFERSDLRKNNSGYSAGIELANDCDAVEVVISCGGGTSLIIRGLEFVKR